MTPFLSQEAGDAPEHALCVIGRPSSIFPYIRRFLIQTGLAHRLMVRFAALLFPHINTVGLHPGFKLRIHHQRVAYGIQGLDEWALRKIPAGAVPSRTHPHSWTIFTRHSSAACFCHPTVGSTRASLQDSRCLRLGARFRCNVALHRQPDQLSVAACLRQNSPPVPWDVASPSPSTWQAFLKHGHAVKMGSRMPAKLTDWVKQHPKGQVGSFADAARFGELVASAVKGTVAGACSDAPQTQRILQGSP